MHPNPSVVLGRSPSSVVIRLGPNVIPGPVERIDILDGAAVISTTSFSPAVAPFGPIELTRWAADPSDPTVVVFFRRPQPGCRVPAPLARSSFRLHQADIEDAEMTTVQPVAESATTAVAAGPPGVSATLDFGTSRSVCGIFDHRRVREVPDDSLTASAVAGVLAELGAEVEFGDDPGLSVDQATRGEPVLRAEAWRAIFDRPPLAVNHLAATKSRSSDLVIDGGIVEFADEKAGADVQFRGVKRRIADLDEEVPGTGLTGAGLFSQVYQRFAELAAQDLKLDAPIRRVHVTFPTKMRPDRKRDLRELLQKIASVVEMDIDEAAAAAGFYLMKRFGSDWQIGVEAFKLQARCPEGFRVWESPDVWGEAEEWHENLLVIDIGGGTTDCALVKVAVADITPAAVGDAPGRFHRLQPRVLASGGRLHLGGDLLTLEVFRVLKERLGIDESATIFEGVEATVRTSRRATFDALWDAAEEVKCRGLAGPEPCDVVVRLGDPRSGTDDAVLLDPKALTEWNPEKRVTITANDLNRILAPVVTRLCALAAGIASGGLDVNVWSGPNKEPRESVDRVVLSGGSMLAESLRNRIEDGLRTRFRLDGLEPTFELEFDNEFCKTGTALGGMYLNAVTDLRHPPEHPLVLKQLRDGLSYFDVDSSRLYVNLAADFYVLRDMQVVYPEPIFRRGAKLSSVDGIPFASSNEDYPVLAQIRVYRFDMPSDSSHEQIEEREEADDSLWGSFDLSVATAQRLHQAGVQMRFEINQDELLTLILCKGTPRPVLTGPRAATAYLPEGGLVRDGLLTHDIYRDVFYPGIGVQHSEPVLRKGTDLTSGVVVEISGSRHVYLDEAAAGTDPGNYPLLLEIPPDHLWLSIDVDGLVRTHPTRPLPPEVAEPELLIDADEGTAFRARLTSRSPYDKNKDPFSGIH